MKKISIIKYGMGIACATLALFTSCNSLDLEPTDKFTDPTYWTTAEKAAAVVNMAYSQMMESSYFFANERLSDNLYEGRGNTDEKLITSGQADAALNRFNDEFGKCYSGIKTCHIFLANVDRVPNMDETLKERLKAEARYIRASLFFRLTCHYGDVPLFDKDITIQEANTIARSPKADVVSFVRSELKAVAEILPNRQQYTKEDNGRITNAAAMMLLARTYLYENDWTNVATICREIMDGKYGKYELFPSYEGLFLPDNEYNKEVILDLGYVLLLRTWSEWYDAIPLTAGGRVSGFSPTQELVDDYIMMNGKGIKETGSGYKENDPYVNRDPRFEKTIVYHGYQWKNGENKVSTIYIKPGAAPDGKATLDEYVGPGQNSTSTGYYLRKYFDPQAPIGMASGLNLILMRYADVLLMYAEAKQELGQMNEEVWNETIKPIRQRAGFVDASAVDYPTSGDLREIIRRERRCELAIEGLRLFDIRRWKTIEKVQNGSLHGAKFAANNTEYIVLDPRKFNKERDYLFAIPQAQRDINKSLTQNPGY